ncbi:peptidoglycan-binding protein [Streptomyces sp. DG2A-72]|uniref:peptidoglycan-binding protein n=1 Tax=Streptomyces sp. DG2A-72 TaxID=3051386 RepID=UPI00265C3EC5|nr:peptidoglycan-binding protein [Streptomyces sp. DG2A-72]MDO0932755.1 peptidoglycan-binding protein [Streptomyces sp. DG2A-72]
MAEPKGHQCPECGAPRGPDHTPSCACTERAAEALREVRTAEAAAAEDFDPLRIRPYVELEGAPEAPPRPADPHSTMPLPAVPPTPPAPAATEPSDADLSLFTGGPAPFGSAPDEESPRRPRRTLMFGVAGVLVTVVTAAGLASGLLSYDTPTRDQALPEEVRASVPDTTPTAAPDSPSASTTPAQPTSAAPSPTPTENGSPSPTPTRSNSPAPTPTRTPDPTNTPTPTAGATDSAGGPENGREAEAPVLSRGDEGPEVVELELRLTQADVYTREAKGTYNEGVEDAVRQYQLWRGIVPQEYGVYDLETRERLESETQEP